MRQPDPANSFALAGISGPGSSSASTDGGQIVFLSGLEFGPLSSAALISNDALISVHYGPVVRAPPPFELLSSSTRERTRLVSSDTTSCPVFSP